MLHKNELNPLLHKAPGNMQAAAKTQPPTANQNPTANRQPPTANPTPMLTLARIDSDGLTPNSGSARALGLRSSAEDPNRDLSLVGAAREGAGLD